MKGLELLIPPPLVMLLVGLMMWVLYKAFPALTLAGYSGSAAVVAIVMVVLGLVISLLGMVAFRRVRTTIDPKRPAATSTLISSGIYRYSRNPMYLGVLLMLTGWGIYLDNLLSMLGILVFVAYITRFQIIPEERVLHKKFGVAFENYKNRVRRWL